jgi:hypothetical protein
VSDGSPKTSGSSDSPADALKQAAETALDQLDWCIRYLAGMRKSKLSARLAKKPDQLKRNLM